MKSLLKFLVITAVVVLLSAVLAPLLFKFLPFKFEKIFNRLIMIFTLAAVAIFVRMDLKKMRDYMGEAQGKGPLLTFTGFGAGLLILFVLTLIKIKFGVAHLNFAELTAWGWLSKILGVFFSAFLIGIIEEFFFRGVVFRALTNSFGKKLLLSVLVTSLFYSMVHFVSIEKPYIGPDPGILDSFKLVAAPFKSFVKWQDYWRAAIGLFIFGVVLNVLAIRTRSLFVSIGLHAGCVFYVKLDGKFVEFMNDYPLVWGSAKMYDGLSGWAALFFLGVLLYYATSEMLRKRT